MSLPHIALRALDVGASCAVAFMAWDGLKGYWAERALLPDMVRGRDDPLAFTLLVLFLAVLLGAIWS